jgi:hypothetical protein
LFIFKFSFFLCYFSRHFASFHPNLGTLEHPANCAADSSSTLRRPSREEGLPEHEQLATGKLKGQVQSHTGGQKAIRQNSIATHSKPSREEGLQRKAEQFANGLKGARNSIFHGILPTLFFLSESWNASKPRSEQLLSAQETIPGGRFPTHEQQSAARSKGDESKKSEFQTRKPLGKTAVHHTKNHPGRKVFQCKEQQSAYRFSRAEKWSENTSRGAFTA